jgi:hypothetical protein
MNDPARVSICGRPAAPAQPRATAGSPYETRGNGVNEAVR